MLQNETSESILPSCAAWKQRLMITWLISYVFNHSKSVKILPINLYNMSYTCTIGVVCMIFVVTIKHVCLRYKLLKDLSKSGCYLRTRMRVTVLKKHFSITLVREDDVQYFTFLCTLILGECSQFWISAKTNNLAPHLWAFLFHIYCFKKWRPLNPTILSSTTMFLESL
jgi:hypothetical protein